MIQRLSYLLLLCGLTGFAIEYLGHVEPCPLCLMERSLFIAAGLAWLGESYSKNLSRIVASGFGLLFLILGLSVSGYHVYLQYFATNIQCGPGIHYLMEIYPFIQAIFEYFKAPAECSKIDLQFFGLSLAVWVFIAYLTATSLIILKVVGFLGRRQMVNNRSVHKVHEDCEP